MKMKLLKVSLTLFMGLIMLGQVSAQETISNDDLISGKALNTPDVPTSDDEKNKAFYEGWKYPINAISSAGGVFDRTVGFLFEDTTVQYVSNQSTRYFTQFHIVGGVLDPTDVNYELEGDGIKFSRFNGYTVDSLWFPYLYVRQVDSFDFGAGNVEVIDTLIVKFYDYEELNYWRANDGSFVFSQPINMTKSVLGSQASTWEVKIPLTKADSTLFSDDGWFSKSRFLDLDIEIPADPNLENSRRNICGFSIAFKTALPFSMDDTLIARDGIDPAKKLNYFGYSQYTNSGASVPQTDYYNNSFFTYGDLLYGGELSGVSGYIPSSFWTNDLYVWYGMKIQTPNLSVADEVSNIDFIIYPNPVSRDEILKLDFNLVNADDVNIELYDLLGNKVKSVANGYFASGEHQIDLNISDLTPGVYLYAVQAGNVKTTKKITITE